MKKIYRFVVMCLMGVSSGQLNAQEMWYDTPAKVWMESLPIGNGRLGSMTYGGVEVETLSMDESTMWSGQFNPVQNKPFGRSRLQELRNQIADGKLIEANGVAGNTMNGVQTTFGTHLPIGDIKLSFSYPEGDTKEYRRSLNLGDAVSSVSFKKGGIKYVREYFSSNPDDVMVFRFMADKAKAINMEMTLDMKRKSDYSVEVNQLVYTGKVDFPMHGPGGVSFQGRIAVLADKGNVKMSADKVTVSEANAVTLIVDVRTDFKSPDYKAICKSSVEKAVAKAYKDMKKAHVEDHGALFHRVAIDFGEDKYADMPIDARWKAVRKGATDTGLDALFFQYGRYLTIASSRENSPLPIALQGFFNDNKACHMGWTNDYHLDINTEQNYWAANVGNLAECHTPLFPFIADLARHGAETARVVYGCNGWTAHTTANVWGYTPACGAINWGLFPTAGAWLASHLWTQYEYTLDKEYLEKTAYPLLKGCAEFLYDYLWEDPKTGYMLTGPSISPENSFKVDGWELCASMMPAVDRQLTYEIFSYCIKSSDILGIDQEFAGLLKEKLAKLPPIKIRANGAICEWNEDYEEAHPNHRHTSHLLALYPFSQISVKKTPELAVAARKTIDQRLSAKDWEDTEWSRANMICFFARLKDAAAAYNSVQMLQGKLSRENLLTVSPGGIAGAGDDIYAFDGNSAGTAGMAEMLLQCHEGYVELLPCLPKAWKDGSFKGLCVRGGAEVSAEWKNARLETAALKATVDNRFRLQIPVCREYKVYVNGRKKDFRLDADRCITVDLKKGDVVELK